MGTSVVARQVKLLPVWLASHELGHFLAVQLPSLLPANTSGKAAEDGPSTLTPAAHVGDWD